MVALVVVVGVAAAVVAAVETDAFVDSFSEPAPLLVYLVAASLDVL